MALVKANGLEIEVERHGNPANPTALLIMGLAAQLTHWPPAFISSLVDAGFHVVAFDNRDIGLSEKLHTKRALRPEQMVMASIIGLRRLAPYRVTDMARDAVGVLDALDIERAHVVGVSMGGMIGQVMGGAHPERLSSFTAIMSSTNNPRLPKADPTITKEIFTVRTRPRSRDELIDRTVRLWEIIGSKNGGYDPSEFRTRIAAAVDRCTYPAGIRRQIAAIIATGDLRRWSRKVKAPTLVIHGTDDPLVPYRGGLDIAANIPNARSELIDGMGHDLPPNYLPTITELVVDHMRSTEENAAAAQAA